MTHSIASNLDAALKHANAVQLPSRQYNLKQHESKWILIDPNGHEYDPDDGLATWRRLKGIELAAAGYQAIKQVQP